MEIQTPFSPSEQARLQILALEATQARAVREFILGDATAVGRLRVIDNQIAALRAQLT